MTWSWFVDIIQARREVNACNHGHYPTVWNSDYVNTELTRGKYGKTQNVMQLSTFLWRMIRFYYFFVIIIILFHYFIFFLRDVLNVSTVNNISCRVVRNVFHCVSSFHEVLFIIKNHTSLWSSLSILYWYRVL